MQWYSINNAEDIDSPSLLLYKERVEANIRAAVQMAHDPKKLRPHVKSNKIAEVCKMMMDAGINKFKCATIAEAEMLAIIKAEDVLIAYQPVGPKANRLLALVKKYPNTSFSCVVDHIDAAKHLASVFSRENIVLNILIDINNGMNRTGVTYAGAISFFDELVKISALNIIGLHVYDGHIRENNFAERQAHSDAALNGIAELVKYVEGKLAREIFIVAGGSATFATHINRNVQTSPGTFIFWDWGYKHLFPEAPFDYSVLVLTRIISIRDENHITIDLGYKSIASEGPLPRVHFLNAPDAEPESHSEEHMVVKVPDSGIFKIGDILFGVPVHICPTVSLYEKALVIENKNVTAEWKVIARDRMITV